MTDRVVRAAQSRAVLVGVTRYDDPGLPDLPSADRAAEDLARAFARWSTEGTMFVDTLVDASRDDVVRALVEAGTQAEDQLVIYFAGHGVVSQFGELVLATRDCNPHSPELTGVPWNSVRRALADTPVRSVLVILDCCFAAANNMAWQETWQTGESAPAGLREPQVTYLMAGRAPWPYQPGVLGAAMRTAIDAVSTEHDAIPDFAAAARLLRHEMADVEQPKLAPSDARPINKYQVFINYRVEDSAVASALDRAVTNRLGREAVFLSARSVSAGTDFVKEITTGIRRARVVVAVIGPGWESRLKGRDDWVVHELATAFEHNVPVVPVLVGQRGGVRSADLPEEIQRLAHMQYLHVRDSTPRTIDAAVERLLQVL